MVKCEICGEDFARITSFHLRYMHNITLDEYKKRFPDAKLVEKYASEPGSIKGEEKADLRFKDEKGVTHRIKCPVTIIERFRAFRVKQRLSTAKALDVLLDAWEELQRLKLKLEDEEYVKKISEASPPKNMAKFHRNQLQKILHMLEERAFKETDPKKLAEIADKIAKINLILPQLDKQHEEEIDKRIEEIIEKRKAICRNYLPESYSMPIQERENEREKSS